MKVKDNTFEKMKTSQCRLKMIIKLFFWIMIVQNWKKNSIFNKYFIY